MEIFFSKTYQRSVRVLTQCDDQETQSNVAVHDVGSMKSFWTDDKAVKYGGAGSRLVGCCTDCDYAYGRICCFIVW